MTAALWVNMHEEKPVRPLADGHMTITVSHVIYLLMWLTDSCLQIYSTKRQLTTEINVDPKWKLKVRRCMCSDTLLIFLVCTFYVEMKEI